MGSILPLRNPFGLSQTFTGVSTTEYAYLLIRNRAEFTNTINLRQLLPLSFGLTVETANRIARSRFVLNPTLSSTVDWQYVDQSRSSTEYALPTNVTITGGQQIGALNAVTQSSENLTDFDIRLEPGDVLAFALRTASSTATVGISLDWHED